MSMQDPGYDGLMQEISDFGMNNKQLAQLAQILSQILQVQQQMLQVLAAPKQTQTIRGPDGKVSGAVHQVVMPNQGPPNG